MDANLVGDYPHKPSSVSHTHAYLIPTVLAELGQVSWPEAGASRRVFDLGCGSGSTAGALAKRGFEVIGVDPSQDGVSIARDRYPEMTFRVGSCYDDLAAQF